MRRSGSRGHDLFCPPSLDFLNRRGRFVVLVVLVVLVQAAQQLGSEIRALFGRRPQDLLEHLARSVTHPLGGYRCHGCPSGLAEIRRPP
jgi:hypothetical protein